MKKTRADPGREIRQDIKYHVRRGVSLQVDQEIGQEVCLGVRQEVSQKVEGEVWQEVWIEVDQAIQATFPHYRISFNHGR